MDFIDFDPSSFAPGVTPDLIDLMSRLDITVWLQAMLFTGASLIAVYILWKGANMILRSFKGQ